MMREKVCIIILVVMIGVLAAGTGLSSALSSKDVPRITAENLKKMLDDPESELIIIDVRTGSSWSKSEVMITSAVRENPSDFDSWAAKHPKEKNFVLYCS